MSSTSTKEHMSVVVYSDYIKQGDCDGYSKQRIVGPYESDEAHRVATKAITKDGLYDRAEVFPLGDPSLVVDMEGDLSEPAED